MAQLCIPPFRLGFLTAIVPLIGLFGSFLISSSLNLVPSCFPLVDGCTSISRMARQHGALQFFRPLAFLTVALLLLFWLHMRIWLAELGDTTRRTSAAHYIGWACAISLLVYANFLGVSGETARTFRRYGAIGFFLTHPFAQLIAWYSLEKIRDSRVLEELRKVRLGIALNCMALILLGLLTATVDTFWPDWNSLDNVIEWNAALLIHSFALLGGWGASITEKKQISAK